MITDKKGCYEYTIEQRDVDFSARSTYIALMDYILEAAGEDADRNGFGVRDLNYDNCSWVLSRMSVEFLRRPAQSEKITVRTWVNEVTRIMTTRNMTVSDQQGRTITKAVTQWAVIDIDGRNALDIREHVDWSRAVTDEPCPAEKPSRIGKVAPTQTVTHCVVYSDIDFNRHVNAMKYIGWMMDLLPIEYLTDREMAHIDINFLHEARYGDTLKVCYEESGERSLFMVENGEGLPSCKAAMTWM